MVSKNQYFIFNGAFRSRYTSDLLPEQWFGISIRSIHFSLFASGNRIPFLPVQLDLIREKLAFLSWPYPDFLLPVSFHSLCVRLINRNRLLKGSHLRLMIYPESDLNSSTGTHPTLGYILFTEESERDELPLNHTGLQAVIEKLPDDALLRFIQTAHRGFAEQYLINRNIARESDLTIFSRNDELVAGSNRGYLFMIRKREVIAPLPADNWNSSAIASYMDELCSMTGYRFRVENSLQASELEKVDELCVVNDNEGFRWILALGKKRYYRKGSVELADALNQLLKTADQLSKGSSG